MKAISYTKARNNFASIMEEVCENHSPIIITRSKEAPVVMLSLDDYNAFEETVYLLKSPKNALRLAEAVKDLRTKDNFKQFGL
jgi:antitoxin YefM